MVLHVGLIRSNINKMMRMLRWISGNTRKYRISNEEIYLKIGVTPIDEKMRESCLRCFGHI